MKTCIESNCTNPVFSNNYCKFHQFLRPAKKKETKNFIPIKRSPIKKTQKQPKLILQDEINKLVRIIDTGHPCISSGKPIITRREAGHYISVGSFIYLRYNLLNIWTQSHEENQMNDNYMKRYAENLVTMYGNVVVDKIADLMATTGPLKLMKHEILEKIKTVRELQKEAESLKKPLENWERLELRILYNKIIGIYAD